MKKKFLKITGILVLFIALVGFWGYNKYFKPDPKIQQQLNNQFGTDFFSSFDDENVVNNSGPVNNVKSVGDLAKKIDSPTIVSMMKKSKEQEEAKIVTTSAPENETIVAKSITQDELNNKYKPQFNHLQSVALSRLDTLYSTAIQEYVQGSKAGTLNRPELVQKYLQAGTMLEASIDSQFYSTLNAMQAELVANNLSTDILGAIKSNYEKAKSAKRSQLLAKVRK
ncbi:hypothetical protein [Desulfosporosinus sp. Sb-LF]|uniref:hypothetical protein n=1 Tax=Desulfosporosinus sp. Sb-LF TaxID=2560027 RepID=UPI00107FB1AF|nr:hypothetical protein [Desulfosporosinus sp. Sb-LF]TGE31660.1 hypothetical protein E4K68_15660 [Desulfosporosinus sp. Sb-LF]